MSAAKRKIQPAALVSQAEYARLRGVSRQAVHKDIRSGKIPTVDGKIDPVAADMALALAADPAKIHASAHGMPETAQRMIPAEDGAVVLSYWEAKAKKESYQAEIARLDCERRRGELVEAGQVKKDAFRFGRQVRDRLEGIPARISAMVAAEGDPLRVQQLLSAEIVAALQGLPHE